MFLSPSLPPPLSLSFSLSSLSLRIEDCLEILISTGRLAEAGFFAQTYLPSQISRFVSKACVPRIGSIVVMAIDCSRVVELWQEQVSKTNSKAAQSIADPKQYENLFPNFQTSLKAERYLQRERSVLRPAADYPHVQVNIRSFWINSSLNN